MKAIIISAVFLISVMAWAQLPLTTKTMINPAAYIPPQCYTATDKKMPDGKTKAAYNPCYTCHRDTVEPNFNRDADLQQNYQFPEYASTNRWTNLFKDRNKEIAAITDAEILSYVRQSNYKSADGKLILAEKLKNLPAEWDFNNDGKWQGYVPDCYFNFDSEGFDRNPDLMKSGGGYTLWRAFAYAPLPGAFWPTNGSADDIMIRRSTPFTLDENGVFSLETYKINLAIVESLIKRQDIPLEASVDEVKYGVDLNKDGKLSTADFIKYDWAPKEGRNMSYVGMAKVMQEKGRVHLAAGLFPEDTEFLHSVRYLDATDKGVGMAERMKELRYAKKTVWYTYSELDRIAYAEKKEKIAFPDRLSVFYGDIEHGLGNGQGWTYQGFIEDRDGGLRPQTYEETTFCMGCHSGLGATTDGIFTFQRKYTGATAYRSGWYHWTQKDLKNTPDRLSDYDGKGMRPEYVSYLENNRAGDEFRENSEVLSGFFDQDGNVRQDKAETVKLDVSTLLIPSSARALAMDKAYRIIVAEQSYIYGRDATATPPENVYKSIPDEKR